MSSYADRLAALREQLKAEKLDGFVVPLTDEHMSEYVGSYAQRLAWLTGFEGSAGSAVVLPEEAAIFVDGRYTLQVRQQVSADQWSYQSVPETSTTQWLEEHAPEGARIGYDPWLHTRDWVNKAKEALATRGAELVAVDSNPIDEIWKDRPEASKAHLVVQPDQYAGKSAAEKRTEIGDWLAKHHADAAVLSALDSIAWAFNIRGADVRTRRSPWPMRWSTPTARRTCSSRARRSAPRCASISAMVFGCTNAPRSKARLPSQGQDRSRRSRAGGCRDLRGARQGRRQDPAAARPDDPAQGDQEPGRDRRPEGRAGRATARPSRSSFAGSTRKRPKGDVDELKASDHLEALRRENPELRDLCFDSISGAGPNGAIVHYRSSEKTNRKLEQGTLYLIDSGGQYVDGTTDITRTVPIGEPTAEMRDRFTRVLKGHIAIATAVFPKGTRGSQLDSFARRPLWEAGPRLRPRHGPRRRQLPRRSRRPAAHFAGRQRAERWRRAAAGRDDHLQRARLLQDRRVRHPDREPRAGRRRARSRARRRICSGSRR